jgi:hypothetical protein
MLKYNITINDRFTTSECMWKLGFGTCKINKALKYFSCWNMVWTTKKGRYMYPHPEQLNMLISVSHGKQRHKRAEVSIELEI